MKYALLIIILFSTVIARGDNVYQLIVQKQEKKAENRWSLSQWLETRDRMRLMDLWLDLHSPSPYEFYVGGEYQFGRENGSVSYNANAGKFFVAAYASLFGLEAQAQLRLSEWTSLFHFRIFGRHAQATNITLQTGLRSRKDPLSHVNLLGGISVTIYLLKNFGVTSLYRHYFKSLENNAGIAESGNRLEGEVFIDFNFVRVYGQYFSELVNRSAGPTAPDRDRNGFAVGAKAFF